MLKLVDKPDLGSGAERRMGSIPFARTRGHLHREMSLFLCGGPRALLWGKCAWYHEKRGYRGHFYLESARGTFYATGWEVGKFSWKVLGGIEIGRGEKVQEKFF